MIQFTLEINPVPQKRTRFGKGHAYNPSKNDMHFMQWQMKPFAPKEPLNGPLYVEYTFCFKIPEKTPIKKRNLMLNNVIKHINNPDGSNCQYLIENAMKGIMYKDDRQICDYRVRKIWAESPRVIIKILDLNVIDFYNHPENILQDVT